MQQSVMQFHMPCFNFNALIPAACCFSSCAAASKQGKKGKAAKGHSSTQQRRSSLDDFIVDDSDEEGGGFHDSSGEEESGSGSESDEGGSTAAAARGRAAVAASLDAAGFSEEFLDWAAAEGLEERLLDGIGQKGPEASCKALFVGDLLKCLVAAGHRTLVFSQSRVMLDILQVSAGYVSNVQLCTVC